MASPHPYGCWWVHGDTQPVPRSSDWRSRKQSSPTTTAAFPWLQGLNATFAYWQITQEKFFLEENQQTWVSALAQILLLQKPGAGATLAFAVTWLKTQTTGEPRHSGFGTPRRCRAGTALSATMPGMLRGPIRLQKSVPGCAVAGEAQVS